MERLPIISKILKSFYQAWRGLRQTYRRELSFRLELGGGVILLAVALIFWPLQEWEFLFLILAFLFILAMELHNTALERALERLHPNHHELVGVSKDTAAASVAIAVLFAVVAVAAIIINHFYLGA